MSQPKSNLIEFRDVTHHWDNKCECGRVTSKYVGFKKQFRLQSGGVWGGWQDVDEQTHVKEPQEMS